MVAREEWLVVVDVKNLDVDLNGAKVGPGHGTAGQRWEITKFFQRK